MFLPRAASASRLALCAGILLAGAPLSGALAAEQHIGTYKDWNAFVLEENGSKVCYMASVPKKSEGNYKDRGDVFVVITHRPSAKSYNVVSFVAGYTYKTGSDVTVTVDKKTFSLFTDGETAWARDDATDKAISDAIRGGSSLSVKGTSAKGTVTTDTYSLGGSGAAHDAINKACNVN